MKNNILFLLLLISSCASPFLNKRSGAIDAKYFNSKLEQPLIEIEKELTRKGTFYHSPYMSTVSIIPMTSSYIVAKNPKNTENNFSKLNCFKFKLRTNTSLAMSSKSWNIIYKGDPRNPQRMSGSGLISTGRSEHDVRRDPRQIERASYEAQGDVCFKESRDYLRGFKVLISPNFPTTEKSIELSWDPPK